ncbi:MAG: hypothetical protein ACRCX2_34020 [Paraclostridium sp.]
MSNANEICMLYKKGHSLRVIGIKYGITHIRVKNILISNGIELRKNNDVKKSTVKKKKKINLIRLLEFDEFTYGNQSDGICITSD